MRKSDGFSLIEVLVAFSIIFMVATTIIPLASFLSIEEERLRERRAIANHLHDELQIYLWRETVQIPADYFKTEKSHKVHYQFTMEDDLIKGCVEWQNVKQQTEKVCLYGLQAK